jgi:hypothetical protein
MPSSDATYAMTAIKSADDKLAANPDMAVPATPRVTVLLMNAWSKPRPTRRGAPAAVPLTP